MSGSPREERFIGDLTGSNHSQNDATVSCKSVQVLDKGDDYGMIGLSD
jgi:hypothetical protein